MSRSLKILLGFVLLLLGAVVYLEASQPDPVRWFPTYAIKDKIPLGTYVFYNSLQKMNPDMQTIHQPPYQVLQDSTKKGTYIFIHQTLDFNPTETKKMLNWVKKGNTILASADAFSNQFLDTLNLKESYKLKAYGRKTFPHYKLVNPKFKTDTAFVFDHDSRLNYFQEIDTASHIVLGLAHIKTDTTDKKLQKDLNREEINFVKIPVGKGKILLHTSPNVFSNYFILKKDNAEYVENLLGYININQPVMYDTYYGPKMVYRTSSLYVLMNNRYLKWTYYFIIFGSLLFIIFEGRRKQKAIKVIPPTKNMTYEYTRTIAGMYLDKKNHTIIAHKKIRQFMTYLKSELRTDITQNNENIIRRLKELTTNTEEDIQALFKLIKNLQTDQNITKDELLKLNQLMNDFKEKA